MTVNGVSDNEAVNPLLAWQNSQTTETVEKKDSLGKDEFLTMLVAQMQNQDPLNPMDGTDYTAQLAQYSGLEQQMNMSETLESILDALQTGAESNVVDYIGKNITIDNSQISISGRDVTGGSFTIDESANVEVVIYNDQGLEVKKLYIGETDAGTYDIEWNGRDNDGKLLSDGTYTYDVIASTDSGGYLSVDKTITGEVTGVTYEDGIAYIMMGDRKISPDNILEIFLPEEVEIDESISNSDESDVVEDSVDESNTDDEIK